MKKILLGLTAAFALSTIPAVSFAQDAPKAEGEKAPKKAKKSKKKAEKKDDGAGAGAK
jgi:hypothetical protein